MQAWLYGTAEWMSTHHTPPLVMATRTQSMWYTICHLFLSTSLFTQMILLLSQIQDTCLPGNTFAHPAPPWSAYGWEYRVGIGHVATWDGDLEHGWIGIAVQRERYQKKQVSLTGLMIGCREGRLPWFPLWICSSSMCSCSRYIAVIYPLHYPNIMTPRRSVVIIGVLWVQACLIGSGPFYCGRWAGADMECLLHTVMPPAFILPLLTVQYFLYSAVMIVLYGRVFYVAHQQRLKINATIGSIDGNNSLLKDTKTAKTLAMVLGAFLISWTPFFCLITIQVAGVEGDYLYTVYVVGILMGVFNSCLNPIIYCWKSSEFRSAYLRLVKRLFRRY